MVKQYKIDKVKELVQQLNKKNNIIITDYSGIKVKDLNILRKNLRDIDIDYKVIKNNFFKRALHDAGYKDIDEYIKGPIAVAFMSNDISTAAKVMRNFKKEHENFNYFLGIMDNVVYTETNISRIADLPSKDVVIGEIMSLINSPAITLAMAINQITATLTRAIKAIAEKKEG